MLFFRSLKEVLRETFYTKHTEHKDSYKLETYLAMFFFSESIKEQNLHLISDI